MTRVTWLGDGSDAETNEWNGLTFEKGKSLDVKDEALVETAKGNKFFKVSGNDAETIEDNPITPPTAGREDDVTKNVSFGSEEELRAHREASQIRADQHDQLVRRGPGRPRKEDGTSKTFAEREPVRPNPVQAPVVPKKDAER